MLLSYDSDMINNLKIILKLYLSFNLTTFVSNSQVLIHYKYNSCHFDIDMINLYL